jgi:hypothetical protein
VTALSCSGLRPEVRLDMRAAGLEPQLFHAAGAVERRNP